MSPNYEYNWVERLEAYLNTKHRIEILSYFDVKLSNPNGDPDNGNRCRELPDRHGFITDVAIKRKWRNYVDLVYGKAPGSQIHVRHRNFREDNQRAALAVAKGDKVKAREILCQTYEDIRTAGAVLPGPTDDKGAGSWNMGQVRGPLQMQFAVSVDPIDALEINLAVTSLQNRTKDNIEEDGVTAKNGTFGNKWVVPFGLYRQEYFWNPFLAEQTGAGNSDMVHFLEAISGRMWDIDRSAARSGMSTRAVIVFQHDNPYGSAPAHELFQLVTVERDLDKFKDDVPTSADQYTLRVCGREVTEDLTLTHKDDASIPQGVKILCVGYARQMLAMVA